MNETQCNTVNTVFKQASHDLICAFFIIRPCDDIKNLVDDFVKSGNKNGKAIII
jgi:hypothetical protein